LFVKYGLNHIVALIEAKKAALVVIPMMSTLSNSSSSSLLSAARWVPYVVVKGKARLGTVVYKKTSAG